jgi:hypothetical protein
MLMDIREDLAGSTTISDSWQVQPRSESYDSEKDVDRNITQDDDVERGEETD